MDNDLDAAYHDSRFTAEISKRMQVPDTIAIGGMDSNFADNNPAMKNKLRGQTRVQEGAAMTMQVPERILVAGGNSHVAAGRILAAKNLPRELQLEHSVMTPSPEQIRVFTPPRSIRLEDHSFPTVDQDDPETPSAMHGQPMTNTGPLPGPTNAAVTRSQQSFQGQVNSSLPGRSPYVHGFAGRMSRETSDLGVHSLSAYKSEKGVGGDNVTMGGGGGSGYSYMSEVAAKESMTPFEELQLVRRQIAKLNHRLMAVELENQQQQQREMIFSILVTAYFFGKFVMWVNRTN